MKNLNPNLRETGKQQNARHHIHADGWEKEREAQLSDEVSAAAMRIDG